MAGLAARHFRLRPVVTIPSRFHTSSSSSSSSMVLHYFGSYPFPYIPNSHHRLHAKKRNSQIKPVIEPSTVDEVALEEEEEVEDDEFLDEFEDDIDDSFNDDYELKESELFVGDGAGGGGISLAGTWWDKEALSIAEKVLSLFDSDLKIYAFRTLVNSTIQVRIEKLSNKSGSPSITDIENFSSAYRSKLDEAEVAGSIPTNISLEVSSPGVERVVRVPEELDRFKDRAMYVKYISDAPEMGEFTESDGVFRLVSYDLESSCCVWGLADVKRNREKSGKGRPLNKKQKEWRLSTPFHCLRLVRLYSDI